MNLPYKQGTGYYEKDFDCTVNHVSVEIKSGAGGCNHPKAPEKRTIQCWVLLFALDNDAEQGNHKDSRADESKPYTQG